MNQVYNVECETGFKRIPTESVDCILTDPPYLYLKNQKLDQPFDEELVFSEFKRILKPKGFVVMFGRGTSFYRWNTILANMGFQFKEEIVWDKSYCTSPLMAISRVHETISIFSKSKGVINRCKVPYLEMKGHDINAIITDIKRLCSTFHNPKSLTAIQNFLSNNVRDYLPDECRRHHVSTQKGFGSEDRAQAVMRAISDGFTEKTIIKQPRYATIHPTQKPVRLLERLLALVTKPGDLVVDPFAGSCSVAKACLNTGRSYICFEKETEYYQSGVESLNGSINRINADQHMQNTGSR